MVLMSNNPWHRLPESRPFVLPEDEAIVRQFNAKAAADHYLHIDEIVPEAFVGARDAPVVLLSNNPGFGEGVEERRNPDFVIKMRRNLLHDPSDYPFLFLAPDFTGPSRQWWISKLKDLIAVFGERVVANSILNVVYFPYPSTRFDHLSLELPCQDYSFRLVREAVDRNAVVVLMRKAEATVQAWKRAVPKLEGYARLYRVRNSQNPSVNRPNCDNFEDIVRAIRERSP
jgi:hypothetical protein